MQHKPPSESQFAKKFRKALGSQDIDYTQIVEGGTPGETDYIVRLPGGRSVYIELKCGSHPLEPEQRRKMTRMITEGHEAYVLRHIGTCVALQKTPWPVRAVGVGADHATLRIQMLPESRSFDHINWRLFLFGYER